MKSNLLRRKHYLNSLMSITIFSRPISMLLYYLRITIDFAAYNSPRYCCSKRDSLSLITSIPNKRSVSPKRSRCERKQAFFSRCPCWLQNNGLYWLLLWLWARASRLQSASGGMQSERKIQMKPAHEQSAIADITLHINKVWPVLSGGMSAVGNRWVIPQRIGRRLSVRPSIRL